MHMAGLEYVFHDTAMLNYPTGNGDNLTKILKLFVFIKLVKDLIRICEKCISHLDQFTKKLYRAQYVNKPDFKTKQTVN